jgi:hypothetical protein
MFLFEKRRRPPCGNQKTFDFMGVKLKQRATASKSFLLLFFKKEALGLLPTETAP